MSDVNTPPAGSGPAIPVVDPDLRLRFPLRSEVVPPAPAPNGTSTDTTANSGTPAA